MQPQKQHTEIHDYPQHEIGFDRSGCRKTAAGHVYAPESRYRQHDNEEYKQDIYHEA